MPASYPGCSAPPRGSLPTHPLFELFGITKQLSQLLLAQPQGFNFQHHVDVGEAVFILVDQELLRIGHVFFLLARNLGSLLRLAGKFGEAAGKGVGNAEAHRNLQALRSVRLTYSAGIGCCGSAPKLMYSSRHGFIRVNWR